MAETLHISEAITDHGQEIGMLIAIIGKGNGGSYHVLDAKTTTMSQKNVWKMSENIVSANKCKASYLINSCTIFT